MITKDEVKHLKAEAVCYFEGTFEELMRTNMPRPHYPENQMFVVVIVPVDEIRGGPTQ